MVDLPSWLAGVIGSAITALGLIFVGLIRARSDKQRTIADWSNQLLLRVDSLEARLEVERRACDERIKAIHDEHREQVAERNAMISCLERKLDDLKAHMRVLEGK